MSITRFFKKNLIINTWYFSTYWYYFKIC